MDFRPDKSLFVNYWIFNSSRNSCRIIVQDVDMVTLNFGVCFAVDEPIAVVLEDLRALTTAVLQEDVSCSDSDS